MNDFMKCKMIAKRCSTISEFQKIDKKLYKKAFENGWLEFICGHMKRQINKRLNAVHCFKVAKSYQNLRDFSLKSPDEFTKCVEKGWLERATKHMKKDKKQG